MRGALPEKDWKYLRSIEKELLAELCRRINQRSVEIVQSESGTEHEKYLTLFRHIEKSDDIIAKCFNDWRRSNLDMKLRFLRRYDLLSPEVLQNLSEEALQLLAR
jgi:hypothetical protein